MPEPPEIGDHYAHILEWFWDLSAARQSGFSGPNPLSLTDIANWSLLSGEIVTSDEVAIIRAMDAAYLTAMAVEQREAADRAKQRM